MIVLVLQMATEKSIEDMLKVVITECEDTEVNSGVQVYRLKINNMQQYAH